MTTGQLLRMQKSALARAKRAYLKEKADVAIAQRLAVEANQRAADSKTVFARLISNAILSDGYFRIELMPSQGWGGDYRIQIRFRVGRGPEYGSEVRMSEYALRSSRPEWVLGFVQSSLEQLSHQAMREFG